MEHCAFFRTHTTTTSRIFQNDLEVFQGFLDVADFFQFCTHVIGGRFWSDQFIRFDFVECFRLSANSGYLILLQIHLCVFSVFLRDAFNITTQLAHGELLNKGAGRPALISIPVRRDRRRGCSASA
ncbi:hypothetical protein D3C80_1523450 [compost metagenome]